MKTTCSEVYPEYRPQQVCYNTFLIFANLVIMREEQTNNSTKKQIIRKGTVYSSYAFSDIRWQISPAFKPNHEHNGRKEGESRPHS